MRKKGQNKKPRNSEIIYDFGQERKIDTINLNTITGQVISLHEGKEIEIKYKRINSGYIRPEKERKILNQIPITGDRFSLDLDRLLGQFDWVFALDTNTQTIRKSPVSVCCVILSRPRIINNLQVIETAPLYAFALWNVKEKPENVAWVTLIENIKLNPSYTTKLNFGLITDSDLDNLDEYNKKKSPIFDQFYLPENMNFIYASVDGGKEWAANKILSRADKEAKKLLKIISNDPEFYDAVSVEGKPYTHLRWWNWTR